MMRRALVIPAVVVKTLLAGDGHEMGLHWLCCVRLAAMAAVVMLAEKSLSANRQYRCS